MSISKKFLKSKPVCKVTFTVGKEMADGAESVALLGEFNNWNTAEPAGHFAPRVKWSSLVY